jgi:AhpD family alkylhydroperoxidase
LNSEDDKEKRIQKLKERARRTREGRNADLWDNLIQMDPDMFEAYQNIYEYGFLDGKQLPAKYRELIAMAILAYRGSREGVIAHAKRAHLLGVTTTEILDAAITTLIPGGAPTFNAYIAALHALKVEKTTSNKSEH